MNSPRIALFFTRKQLLDFANMLHTRIKYKKNIRLYDDEYQRLLSMRIQLVEALTDLY